MRPIVWLGGFLASALLAGTGHASGPVAAPTNITVKGDAAEQIIDVEQSFWQGFESVQRVELQPAEPLAEQAAAMTEQVSRYRSEVNTALDDIAADVVKIDAALATLKTQQAKGLQVPYLGLEKPPA
jgi:hypothetical protein